MKSPASEDDRVWRALSEQTRRNMLDQLADAPRTTGALVDQFAPLCRTAVMKHLDVLVAAKLVLVRWEGRVRWNYFNPVPIERICRRWIDGRRRRTTEALLRLKKVVELNVGEVESKSAEKSIR